MERLSEAFPCWSCIDFRERPDSFVIAMSALGWLQYALDEVRGPLEEEAEAEEEDAAGRKVPPRYGVASRRTSCRHRGLPRMLRRVTARAMAVRRRGRRGSGAKRLR